MTVTGPVFFETSITIDTVDGGTDGNLTFTDQVNASTAGAESLGIVAGDGTIDAQDDIGSGTDGKLAWVDFSAATIHLHDVATTGTQLYTADTSITTNSSYTSEGATITFAGPMTLNDNTTVDTTIDGNSAGADIGFLGLLDSDMAFARSLQLTAGTGGNIAFDEEVGGTALGDVTIHSAGDVDADEAFTAASLTHTTVGTGDVQFASTLTTAGGTDTAGGNVSITTDGIITIGDTLDARGGIDDNGSGGNDGGTVTLPGSTAAVDEISTSGSAAKVGSGQDGGAAGDISITATHDPNAQITLNDSLTALGGAGDGGGSDGAGGTVTLTSQNTGGGVTQVGGSVAATNLLLLGGGTFALDQPGNDVDIVAVDLDPGSVLLADSDDIEIGSVNGTDGIATGTAVAAGGSVTINATSGKITVSQSIDTTSGTGGGVTITGDVEVNASLTAGGGTIELNGNTSGTGDIVIEDSISSPGTIDLQASRDIIVGARVQTTGSGADILLTADANSNGVGGVQVKTAGQLDSARDVTVGGSDLWITGVGVGDPRDGVEVQADGASLQIVAGHSISLSSGAAAPGEADILIHGHMIATSGSIDVDAADRIELKNDITSGTDTTLRDAGIVMDDVIVTAGGNVTFESTVDDDGSGTTGSDLIVNASGTTRFNAEVGGTAPLESITTDNPGVTEIETDISTSGGTVRFNDPVLLTGDVTITDTGTTGITFTDTLDIETDEHNSLTLTAVTGHVVFDGDIGAGTPGDQTLGKLTATDAARVTFGNNDGVSRVKTDEAVDIGSGSVITNGIVLNGGAGGQFTLSTTGDPVRFNGAVTLATDVSIDTDSTDVDGEGGTITFTNDAPVDSAAGEANNLVLDGGTADVRFNANIGADGVGSELGRLVVEEADLGVTFGEDDTDLGAGTTSFVTTIELVGDGTGAAALDVGTGSDEIGGVGIVLNGGTADDQLTVQTTGDAIRLNGPVTLQTNVTLDTDLADPGEGGTITFTRAATIDSQSGETNDLFVDAGDGSVLFNANLGSSDRLGTFTVDRAAGGVVFGQSDTDTGPGGTDVVTQVMTNGPIDIGSETTADDVIGGTGIVLNGGGNNQFDNLDTFAGDSMLLITTTGDDVRFNGAVSLNSDLVINTVDNAAVPQGRVTFTGDAPVSSQADDRNSLTVTAEVVDIGATVDTTGQVGGVAGGPMTINADDLVIDPVNGSVNVGRVGRRCEHRQAQHDDQGPTEGDGRQAFDPGDPGTRPSAEGRSRARTTQDACRL